MKAIQRLGLIPRQNSNAGKQLDNNVAEVGFEWLALSRILRGIQLLVHKRRFQDHRFQNFRSSMYR